jgi:hypothetical protein
MNGLTTKLLLLLCLCASGISARAADDNQAGPYSRSLARCSSDKIGWEPKNAVSCFKNENARLNSTPSKKIVKPGDAPYSGNNRVNGLMATCEKNFTIGKEMADCMWNAFNGAALSEISYHSHTEVRSGDGSDGIVQE